jgi:indolepyruvate ferredoxin oxidoreductase beta subunit
MISAERPITIAVTALGGQGGGVLAGWIRDLAEANGYFAQSTSVPGVAQRTGATVYYLELFPESAAQARGKAPVLSLSPVAGDVDIVIAAEWMEAGRAIQRGFVTPERTTLIASTHRDFAVGEKIAMGDGIADSSTVLEAARRAARRLISFDMKRIAEQCDAVISASLFGALGGSGLLPFGRDAFERVIAGSGAAAESSLRAFGEAWSLAERPSGHAEAVERGALDLPAAKASPRGEQLRERIARGLPAQVGALAFEGCRQLADYQDVAYAQLYLARLEAVAAADADAGGAGRGFALTSAVARHLALWMAYQDVIRVADQKTRAARYAEIRREVRADAGDLVYPVEFMHPRIEEICDILPRALGARVLRSTRLREFAQRFFQKGRLVHTYGLGGYLMLYVLAAMRPLRRSSLRFALETVRIEDWLHQVETSLAANYELAVEVAGCPRLLKGYSDTQQRGWRNFTRIMDFLRAAPRGAVDAALLRRLREAALADEAGKALDALLKESACTVT